MIKIEDHFLFHMFQAILKIYYLECLNLWEGVEPGMYNFNWYKITELSEISIKKTVYALRRGDHTFEHFINLPVFEVVLGPCCSLYVIWFSSY